MHASFRPIVLQITTGIREVLQMSIANRKFVGGSSALTALGRSVRHGVWTESDAI
jgi:hypothetical protein